MNEKGCCQPLKRSFLLSMNSLPGLIIKHVSVVQRQTGSVAV